MRSSDVLTVGERFTSGSISFTESDIIAFAGLFDPQPYHLDKAAGYASIFGGLCASGWQVAAFTNRLLSEAFLNADIDFVEITRVDQMRWKKPLFVDESIRVNAEITHITEASTIPGCRDVGISVAVQGKDGSSVAVMTCHVAIARGEGQAA